MPEGDPTRDPRARPPMNAADVLDRMADCMERAARKEDCDDDER